MANQSYLSVWCTDFSEERMLDLFRRLLETVPYSAKMPGFSYLAIRAVSAAESPVMEHDLRSMPLNPEGIVELAREGLNRDAGFEVRCHCDLWIYDAATEQWKREPQPAELYCNGPDYDDEVWKDSGHFLVNFGFEHVFTGHAGLLSMRQSELPVAESPEEARFLELMTWPENLEVYRDKTRENIRMIFDWVQRIEKALPVKQLRLWSEGEENFEARIEQILTAR